MYYGPKIIIDTGITIPGLSLDEVGIILNMPLAFMNAVGGVITIFYVDKKGRRFMMLRTLPGMIAS